MDINGMLCCTTPRFTCGIIKTAVTSSHSRSLDPGYGEPTCFCSLPRHCLFSNSRALCNFAELHVKNHPFLKRRGYARIPKIRSCEYQLYAFQGYSIKELRKAGQLQRPPCRCATRIVLRYQVEIISNIAPPVDALKKKRC